MTPARLITRSLLHYWSTGLVVVFGLAVSTAVVTGSLVIGDSVEGSLRDVALSRLGTITHTVSTPRHFRADLARDISLRLDWRPTAALLSAQGSAKPQDSDAVVPDVSVWGIDGDFWRLHPAVTDPPALTGRQCAINEALAVDLGVSVGDALLVRVGKQGAGGGTLFARRDLSDAAPSMRVSIAAVLPAGGAADFRLDAQNATPRNVFIAREWLAARLGLDEVADTVTIAANAAEAQQGLEAAVADSLVLDDYGLRLADSPTSGHLVLSSDAMTLSSAEVQAAQEAAEDVGAGAAISSVYLVNEVRNLRSGRSLAYSMAAGLQPAEGFRLLRGTGEPSGDSIWLNEWAAADLAAAPGDELVLRYMLPTEEGSYPTEQITGRVSGIVAMEAAGADPGLVPEFKGITDAEHVDEWDTPFPIDYSLIRDRDEEYWDRYRAAPKLFMDPARLQAIWRSAPGGEEADWVTSVRVRPPEHAATGLTVAYTRRLRARLAEGQTTITLRPVRELALVASKGTSDFSGLFLGLSMFLVFAGAGLGGMLLRLSVDRRASQAGIMLATGCPEATVHRALRAEGFLLSVVGTLVGLPAGVLYARAIIGALERWWAGAIGSTSTLWLHVDSSSILIGAVAGLSVGVLVTVLSTHGLVRVPLLSLLGGWRGISMAPALNSGKAARPTLIITLSVACVLGAVSLGTGHLDPATAFFGIGACLLAASLSGASLLLSGARRMTGATGSLPRLALRNAAAGGARSVLVIGLLACATFVVVAVAANGRDPSRMDTSSREAGSGGYELMATSSVPLPYDPKTATGRANLGFLPEDEAALEGAVIVSLPAGPGEDISCLNIARPSHPRIIGVPEELIQRGGFSFAGQRSTQPWELLTHGGDGALPAFGDAASVQWTLHLGQGDEYSVQTPRGESVLRFAGLLKGSIFQSELLVSRAGFRQLYPDISSPSYLLIDTPEGKQEQVRQVLMARLGELGLRVRTTSEVLDGYLQVQNTYLSMFLALGGLGLLLGTIGLVTALLRGAFERRGELALMLATGFPASRVRALLVAENGGLLVVGLVVGAACALVAVAPHLASAEVEVNWQFLVAVLSGIILFGLVSCAVAVSGAVGGRLIGSLRAE